MLFVRCITIVATGVETKRSVFDSVLEQTILRIRSKSPGSQLPFSQRPHLRPRPCSRHHCCCCRSHQRPWEFSHHLNQTIRRRETGFVLEGKLDTCPCHSTFDTRRSFVLVRLSTALFTAPMHSFSNSTVYSASRQNW